ncbi:MAG: hypothetical protein R2857_12540 [Vampirovibrionales bacterium]
MDLNGQLALISDLLSSVADQLPVDQHGLVRALHQGIEAFENVLAGHKAWAEAPGPLSDQAVVTLPEQAALQAQNPNQNHVSNSPTAKGLLGLPETAQANQKADALLPGQPVPSTCCGRYSTSSNGSARWRMTGLAINLPEPTHWV